MQRLLKLPVFFVGVLLFVASCNRHQDVVNVYSGRHYQVDESLFQEFTRQTGIRVNLVKADTDQLIHRLRLEGSNTPADILITADAGRMVQCVEAGLLQPMDAEAVENVVPSSLRDAGHYWTGFTKRARVIVYDKERVDPSELSTYEDLADIKWQNRILVRSSQNHYNQTLMASLVAAHGRDKALQWARGIVANMAQSPRGNDRDQVKAIAAGVGDLAIVNTYYMGLLLHSSNAEERRVGRQMGVFFPNQNDRGTHVNISGVALTAHAPNVQNAQKLIRFLLSEEAQTRFARENFEYPVRENIAWTPQLEEWGRFRADTFPLHQLGKSLNPAMIIFDQAGWN